MLGYHQYIENLDRAKQHNDIVKLLHFILRGTNGKLYEAAYPNIEVDDPDSLINHTYGVDDLEGLEGLLKRIDGLSTKTQAELDRNDWSEWG